MSRSAAKLQMAAPWLQLVFREHAGEDDQDVIDVTCLVCKHGHIETLDREGGWYQRITLQFEHAPDCKVPIHRALAEAGRWN